MQPREIELKLAVTAADVSRLRERLQRFGAPRVEKLQTVYYDTADFALGRRGMALRVRKAGTRWLQTLKTGDRIAALAQRGEWEMPAPRGRLDVDRFADTPLAELLRAEPLQIAPRFRTRFERAIWMTMDGAIEIALDQGEIVAGKRSALILELELELKAGPTAALWVLARELAGSRGEALALLPFGESKAARGVRLATGTPALPVKANAKAFAAQLGARLPVDAALRAIVATGTHLMLANTEGLREADDAEFIHQARVAVRRMRSAIRLLQAEVAFPASLAADLRWIGRELGGARDWDVIVLHTLPTLVPAAAQKSNTLVSAAEVRRSRARERARASLASPRFARLALRLLQWAEGSTQSAQQPAPARNAQTAKAGAQQAAKGAGQGAVGSAARTVTLEQFAPKSLRRAHRRLFKAAQFFVALAPERQHRVRILAKRLRYAIDVLAGAFARGATDAFSKALSSLQDVLGELNDVAVAQEVLAELASPSGERDALQSALAQRRQSLAVESEKALAALARLRQPWRTRR